MRFIVVALCGFLAIPSHVRAQTILPAVALGSGTPDIQNERPPAGKRPATEVKDGPRWTPEGFERPLSQGLVRDSLFDRRSGLSPFDARLLSRQALPQTTSRSSAKRTAVGLGSAMVLAGFLLTITSRRVNEDNPFEDEYNNGKLALGAGLVGGGIALATWGARR